MQGLFYFYEILKRKMNKYAVARNRENYKEVNAFFNQLNNTARFTADGHYVGIKRDRDYLHYPAFGGETHSPRILNIDLQPGYEEVSLEFLKECIKKQSTVNKYTKEDLNNQKLNLVCHITSPEQHAQLKVICPEMSGYDPSCNAYITGNGGSASCRHYRESGYRNYQVIEFDQVDFGTKEEISPIPEFWQIQRTLETAAVINEWMNKHHVLKHSYHRYNDPRGYVNNKNLNKRDENLPEITFEQFQKYVLNQTPTQNMEKKIIGYKAPRDLFKGRIKQGDLFSEKSSEGFVMYNKNHMTSGVPTEIVETWEPVYEEEFKVEDWVVFDVEKAKDWENGAGYTDTWNAPHVLKIDGVGERNLQFKGEQHPYRQGQSFSNYKELFRKATPEEIKKAQTIKIGEYEAEFHPGLVKFGCQRFRKEELETIQKALFRSDFTTELIINGIGITKELLTKLISGIK
jgi:hypothetical protein